MWFLIACVLPLDTHDSKSPAWTCDQVAITDESGGPDPCDVAACQTCFDTCGGATCMVLESYPPQYACEGGGSWSVYDVCPSWVMPGTPYAVDEEELGCGDGTQVETLTASVADRNAAISEKDATIADLRSQVASYEAVLNPPDAIYPFEFVSLLTDDQLTAVQLSTDPTLIRLRTQVQTIVTPIPFGDGSPLRNGVAYLGMVLPDLFPPEEVARIISRTAPE